jgi:hypothetical protein
VATDQPRCASCGHERINHWEGEHPWCADGPHVHACPCTGWQEPSVPEPRTPVGALRDAILKAAPWPPARGAAVATATADILAALTAAGWSLVRTEGSTDA